jgi:mannose-6-phosphate isomerase-like protein (cupin superfamily)
VDEDVIRLGPHQELRVVSSAPERLELEATWRPGSTEPPAHLHPGQDERFAVREGELTVVLGDEPARTVRAGETIAVPRGTPHRMWNAGVAQARARWVVTPALRTEEMFRVLASGDVPPDFLDEFGAELRLA